MEEVGDLHQLSIGILGGDHLGLGLDHALPGGEGDSGRMESPGRGQTPPHDWSEVMLAPWVFQSAEHRTLLSFQLLPS